MVLAFGKFNLQPDGSFQRGFAKAPLEVSQQGILDALVQTPYDTARAAQ